MSKRVVTGIILTLFLLSISGIGTVTAVVVTPVEILAWLDKPQYSTGDNGILHITVRNDLDEPLEVHNISVTYPWFAYVKDHWEGNETLKDLNVVLPSQGDEYYTEMAFTVPTDGRPSSGFIDIIIYIGIGFDTDMYLESVYISASAPLTGDVNDDGIVDIFDGVIIGVAFGSKPGDPKWNPTADLNNDDIVDIFDLVIIGVNFGKTW